MSHDMIVATYEARETKVLTNYQYLSGAVERFSRHINALKR
jgi:hypothetical protein